MPELTRSANLQAFAPSFWPEFQPAPRSIARKTPIARTTRSIEQHFARVQAATWAKRAVVSSEIACFSAHIISKRQSAQSEKIFTCFLLAFDASKFHKIGNKHLKQFLPIHRRNI